MIRNVFKNKEKSFKPATFGFTLIELLAVIAILAIIALIVVPIVLNIINDTKKESARISAENYFEAVELAIMNKELDIKSKNLDGTYTITEEGKKIESKDNQIEVEYDGEAIKQGTIIIENKKVKKVKETKIDKWYAYIVLGKVKLFNKIPESTIIDGGSFNKKIKTLANDSSSISTAFSVDNNIKSIEFLSFGKLPKEYSNLEDLQKLPGINVTDSNSKGEPIIAYYNSTTGKVYVYSENLILFNSNSGAMFVNFKGLENLMFGEIDTSNMTNMNSMFSLLIALKRIDFSNFDTSNVESMFGTFQSSSSLEELDLSGFNTSNVTDMRQMFYECSGLKQLYVSNFDTSNVENMGSMFHGCSGLTELDVSSFKTPKVTNMGSMFMDTGNLISLDLGNFDTTKVNNMAWMFRSANNLKTLNISGFTFNESVDLGGMFAGTGNINIIVGGLKQKELISTLHTTANIKIGK